MNPISALVKLGIDGKLWCALIGDDLQTGIAGFGVTPAEALRDLAQRMEAEQSAKPAIFYALFS